MDRKDLAVNHVGQVEHLDVEVEVGEPEIGDERDAQPRLDQA